MHCPVSRLVHAVIFLFFDDRQVQCLLWLMACIACYPPLHAETMINDYVTLGLHRVHCMWRWRIAQRLNGTDCFDLLICIMN